MYICYVDESGTSSVPGNTSHFVLSGLAIPIHRWNACDIEINKIKARYGLANAEIHTAWILRKYPEQHKIQNFESMGATDRQRTVAQARNGHLLKLQQSGKGGYRQTKKNYEKTADYVHLTWNERQTFISEIADCVSRWQFARLFAECIDKLHFDPDRNRRSVDEQAFEQVVSRFEHFLQATANDNEGQGNFGLLIHDNNETVARKHTQLMKHFHEHGTLWTEIHRIVETPLFVDSALTSLVQVADLCSYSLRRYLENQETALFEKIFERADRRNAITVGVRHFSNQSCNCLICLKHSGA